MRRCGKLTKDEERIFESIILRKTQDSYQSYGQKTLNHMVNIAHATQGLTANKIFKIFKNA